MAKATHYGQCQVCMAKQKLPGGKLSKHGYTVDWGFFNGVCIGADHLPYEQDCSLCVQARDAALRQAEQLDAGVAEIRGGCKPGTTKAWVHHYHSAGWDRSERSGYIWIEVELIDIRWVTGLSHGRDFIGGFAYEYRGKKHGGDHHVKSGTGSNYPESVDDLVNGLNEYYAKCFLSRNAQEARKYAANQDRRIREWQLRELTPIEEVSNVKR